MIFGTAIGPMIEGKNADELLDAAFAKGINTFDTARGYGRAEESLGGWMKRRDNREQVVVISKCGNCDSDGSVCVNRKVIETELAEKKGCTVSQIALAWMFRQDLNIYVLVSTTKAFRLEENLRAFTVELSEEESRYLNAGCKATAFMSK